MLNFDDSILYKFNPVKLEEMDRVSLLDRMDTKYVINANDLGKFLLLLSDSYLILEIDGRRQFSYDTLYYDTSGADMFLSHVRGKLNRYKVRKRVYVESDLTFLEVKYKMAHNRGFQTKQRFWQNEYQQRIFS